MSLPASTTPTGLQSSHVLFRRRLLVVALNVTTYLVLAWVLAGILGRGGWTVLDVAFFVCFLFAAPWSVLGLWNALIGLWLLHGRRDWLAQTAPYAAAGEGTGPLGLTTAVLMTLRNEDPARALHRLAIVKDSLDATGQGAAFSYFILSDSNRPEVIAAEEAAVAAWKASTDAPHRITYRRRLSNEGFKAGNVRDFCDRWGRDFDLMLPLDADSLMDGPTILKLVRMMEAHPRLGILQSLVVGLPSRSAFARLFQFGMRQGMRPYTVGSAWWGADCGPFWGHNALVRIAPFVAACHLPVLPGKPPLGGPILSHDQVEACLMRRAGYEVRVLPVETGSWEENPPTVLDFVRRDLRWCQGNMQYWPLLRWPGLLPMSRFQLAWAILMFLGIPAWTLMILLAALKPFETADLAAGFPVGQAIGLYLAFLGMFLAPKLAGIVDILLTRGGTARYGGTPKFLAAAAMEIVFSFLVGATTTVHVSLFMVGLLLGRSISWNGQARDARAVSIADAARALWLPTAFGTLVIALMAAGAPALLAWALPLVAGFPLAIPFAVGTAHPAFSRFLVERRLAAIPEEIDTPAAVAALDRPAPGPAVSQAA